LNPPASPWILQYPVIFSYTKINAPDNESLEIKKRKYFYIL
jgi:hypothetical protein